MKSQITIETLADILHAADMAHFHEDVQFPKMTPAALRVYIADARDALSKSGNIVLPEVDMSADDPDAYYARRRFAIYHAIIEAAAPHMTDDPVPPMTEGQRNMHLARRVHALDKHKAPNIPDFDALSKRGQEKYVDVVLDMLKHDTFESLIENEGILYTLDQMEYLRRIYAIAHGDE